VKSYRRSEAEIHMFSEWP